MTLRPRTVAVFACLAIACAVSVARSDDKPAKPSPADQAAMAEAYMKAAAPGPEHARLKEMAGEWDAEVKVMQPDGSRSTSKGVMHAKMILGDRYLQLNYEGEMDMGPAGKMPFHGVGIGGYDKGKKKYTSVWIDEMSTAMMITEGTVDANGVLTTEGSMTDPMSGQPMKVKEVSSTVDKDHHKYELHMSEPGSPNVTKILEITYTRKK
jgi:hypothetical protein